MKRHLIIVSRSLFFLAFILLAACQKTQPVKIGFIAGMSGKVADLGVAGRNGAMLAIEERNAVGGVKGRPVELVIRDDEQNPETANRVTAELLKENVELIIGPMTSSIAMAIMPQIEKSSAILLSPTVTTTDLQAKDDNFLRVISTTSDYADKSARYQYHHLGHRSVAAIYDIGNRSYTESWLNGFRRTFEGLGGKMVSTLTYTSKPDTSFLPLASALLSAKPDLVLVIANSVDAALICQQLRKLNRSVDIVLSEWASTERLIELGGQSVDGIYVAQFLNRIDPSPRYQDFVKAYQTRFAQEPGFAGLAGYDAALVAMEALQSRNDAEPLKQALLRKKTFNCVQQQITIDQFGDADRKTYLTRIVNGKYQTLE